MTAFDTAWRKEREDALASQLQAAYDEGREHQNFQRFIHVANPIEVMMPNNPKPQPMFRDHISSTRLVNDEGEYIDAKEALEDMMDDLKNLARPRKNPKDPKYARIFIPNPQSKMKEIGDFHLDEGKSEEWQEKNASEPMTAFDTAWSLIKADQDFYIGAKRLPSGGFDWDANRLDLAQKRAWLYNEPIPQTLDEADENMWTDGWSNTTHGQASTRYGYQPKINALTGEPFTTYSGNVVLDYDKPIRGPGRVLFNLPALYGSVKDAKHREWIKTDDAKQRLEDWRNLPIRRRYGKYSRPRPQAPDVSYSELMERIIELINHEIGHTTQIDEEEEWERQTRSKSGWDWQRHPFMQESLASIYESPHDLNWRKRIANYGGMDMKDYHDRMRELSYGMAKFFEENPDVYRSPEQVKRDKDELRELLSRIDEE